MIKRALRFKKGYFKINNANIENVLKKGYYKTHLEEPDYGFEPDNTEGDAWVIEPDGKIILVNGTHIHYLYDKIKKIPNMSVEKAAILQNFILIRDYGFKKGLLLDVNHLDSSTEHKLKKFIDEYGYKLHAQHFVMEDSKGNKYEGSIDDFYSGNFRRSLKFPGHVAPDIF